MSRFNSLPVVGRLVIAALVGATCGATAAVWSVGGRSKVASSAPSARVITSSSSIPPAGQYPSPHALTRRDSATAPSAGQVQDAPARSNVPEGDEVLQRARALAQRADVRALVALREGIARNAEGGGETGSALSKQQLEEFDRYLEEARFLRLKLDAEEFKRAESAGSRPR